MKDKRNHIAPPVRTVISMQPAEHAEKLRQVLKNNDIVFFNMPMIRTETVALQPEIRNVFDEIEFFDILIFTSRNGVNAFFELWQKLQRPFPEKLKIAAIGKGTFEEVSRHNRQADFVQPGSTSRDFANYLKTSVIKGGEKVLLALGNLASDFLQNELQKQASITRINVYRTLPVRKIDSGLMQKIRDGQYGLLIFSSPSIFENFYSHYQNQKEKTDIPLRIVSIGETTTRAILNTTRAFVITAKEPGTTGLLNEIINYLH